jgi:hypothetical protein
MHPLETLFNLDYHLAVLHARAGHPGYAEWLDRMPSGLSVQAHQPSPAPRPLETLAGDLPELEGKHLRHALGTSARAIAIAAQSDLQEDLAQWSALAQRLPWHRQLVLDRLMSLEPMAAYVTAAFTSGCAISNVSFDFSFDSFEVTTISLSFDVDRPIEDFVKSYDPRMWDVEARECFRIADRIAEAETTKPIPGSTDDPPPPQLPTEAEEQDEAGMPGCFPLYEMAVTAAGGGGAWVPALSDFRNILSIDYRVTSASTGLPEPAKIELEYALSEAITMIITGVATAGGLDVDSGHAFITRLPDHAVHIEASKSVRVARPRWIRDWLNFSMAAILPFWFLNLVLLGACRDQDAQ